MATTEKANLTGEQVYRKQCMDCHGASGEGVKDEYEEALFGDWSIGKLARYVTKNMPEEKPKLCVDKDAAKVAKYIHDAFYSPEAQARKNPPRITFAHLTNRQYRESIADLVSRPNSLAKGEKGLQASYFDSKGMNKKNALKHKRIEGKIDHDFGGGPPMEGMNAEQYSIAWEGSLRTRETGFYEFRVSTPNGVRLYLNADIKAGDKNQRDDASSDSQHPLIDAWVSSGDKMQVEKARLFLLGGRSYPMRLDYFKYKKKAGSIRLEWKPANGAWEIPGGADFATPDTPRVMAVTTPFPADDHSLGYNRGSTVSREWLRAITHAAIEVANEIDGRLPRLSGVSKKDPYKVKRLKDFTTTFAERAFRRPLTKEEQSRYVEALFAEAKTPELAVKLAVMLMLKSPHFLYPDLPSEAMPNSYRTASRLALGLWDSIPDEKLLRLAREGRIKKREQVEAEARRMLDDPRSRSKVLGFFHHWLGMDVYRDLLKDAKGYPGFDDQMIADLRHSLNLFVEELVWSKDSDYRQLLLSNHLYLNGRLAKLYGKKVSGEGFQKVAFDPKRRTGVLTHPYLLTAYAYPDNSSPIHRGVFLTRNIVGRLLKPPPKATPFRGEKLDSSLTMREKVSEVTKAAACMGCHRTINPLGFSLEHYDAIGRWRSNENDKQVNSTSDYEDRNGDLIRLRGARDLAEFAAGNDAACKTFIAQLFRHLIKQPVGAYGKDTLENLHRKFKGSQFNIKDLIIEILCVTSLHGLEKTNS